MKEHSCCHNVYPVDIQVKSHNQIRYVLHGERELP